LGGTFTKEYLYMGKVRVAMVDVAGGGTVYAYQNDRLGTPELLTTRIDNQETVVWEAWHEPFGEAHIHPSSSVVNNIRLPGQYCDAETGNHYNYRRYYDPRTGRYLTPDPINLSQTQLVGQSAINRVMQSISAPFMFADVETFLFSSLLYQYQLITPQGLNLYGYTMNNPVNSTDSKGTIVFAPVLYFAGAKALSLAIAYFGTKLAQWGASQGNTCEATIQEQNGEIDRAFELIAVANVAEIGIVGAVNLGLAVGPAVSTAVMTNPGAIQNAVDLVQGAIVPTPPPPSVGGYLGYVAGEAAREILWP
jgi:RHS repeat-associated protein